MVYTIDFSQAVFNRKMNALETAQTNIKRAVAQLSSEVRSIKSFWTGPAAAKLIQDAEDLQRKLNRVCQAMNANKSALREIASKLTTAENNAKSTISSLANDIAGIKVQ